MIGTNPLRSAAAVLASALLAGNASAQSLTVFAPGTPAKASEVNANFSALQGQITTLQGQVRGSPRWMGAWLPTVTYVANDVVEYQGSAFIAVGTTTAVSPPGSGWSLLAAAGAPGAQGPQGPTGPVGLQGGPGVQGPAGASGVDGFDSLMTSVVEPPGANCPAGGRRLTSGLDANRNGVLDAGEVSSTSYACNGVNGAPGTNGVSVTSTSLPIGDANCPYGGSSFTSASGTTYACSGQVPAGSVYRYAVFDTYDQYAGWMGNNNPTIFGGINPSNWTDGNALASQLSSDKDVLRALYTRTGRGGANALVHAESMFYYSSTNGKVVTALFRVKNTTGSAITWSPSMMWSGYGSWNEWASIALNGVGVWNSAGTNSPAGAPSTLTTPISIPPNRTSTVVFVATSGPPFGSSTRAVLMAFVNNSLRLPAGLVFVDDLDTATGGWEQ